MKIATIVGARPQFIKAAVVSRELAKHGGVQEIIIHTGQHFDRNMSDVFFDEMRIPRPHHLLDVHSLQHGAMTGRMLERLEATLTTERPDRVMVYGDTNSTIAGALAAKKLNLSVIHIEAGLRSFNMTMPEEINRVVTDRISDLLCCPTDNAVDNLRREGFEHFGCTVVRTGDVMYDAALYYGALSAKTSTIIDQLNLRDQPFALCTIHRAENTDDQNRFSAIVSALNALADEMRIVLPLHPRTAKVLKMVGAELAFEPIEPVGYFDMLELLKECRIVLTDSGGLQKEAYFFSKPCVTLRDETEWVELCECGANVLAGADRQRIVDAVDLMLHHDFACHDGLYGAGDAGTRIVNAILGKPVSAVAAQR